MLLTMSFMWTEFFREQCTKDECERYEISLFENAFCLNERKQVDPARSKICDVW